MVETSASENRGCGKARRGPATAACLVEAARAEFHEHGYAGTDSNRIARRAGFAPQTFYRWFADKAAVFIAVYRAWEEAERDALAALIAAGAQAPTLARAILDHHRNHRLFRRSLRQLAVEHEAVRAARTASRRRQIEALRRLAGEAAPPLATIAATLFEIERLADAAAEGEFADLGLDDGTAETAIAASLARLLPAVRNALTTPALSSNNGVLADRW